jgi:hypothetical protein
MTAPGTAIVCADVVLTPVPYAFYLSEQEQIATTTAYTTREPGLLIRSRDPREDEDESRWLIAHWQGEAIQGRRDYTSPWRALAVADQLGALGVDWRRTSAALKADGEPYGLWEALLPGALTDRAGELIETVTRAGDPGQWHCHEAVMDLLSIGWTPTALTGRLSEDSTAIPLARRMRPLLEALAPLDGRPTWCGQCLPVARQNADARGRLTRCPRCHPDRPDASQVVAG